MVAPDDFVFDLAQPRRPTLDDVGGALLYDDPKYAPNTANMPYAAMLNQQAKLVAAYGGLLPVAVIWIRIISGAPTIYAAEFASAELVAGDITVIDQAAGITRLEWAAYTFPSPLGEPDVSLTYTTDANNPALTTMAAPFGELITNGVRVRTRNVAGTEVDHNFKIALF